MKQLRFAVITLLIACGCSLVVATTSSAQSQRDLIQSSACQSSDTATCITATCDPSLPNSAACRSCNTEANRKTASCRQLNECQKDKCNLIVKYLNPIIRLLSIIVGVAVTIGIIIGGIQYASSAGDPQKVSNAKHRIRNSIVALIFFFFLYALLRFLIPGTGLLTT
ncbi:MAG TPA: hypothetical protein VK983_03690 [Candidatus Limnocylindrales bacterium]|nr:hypothetical protein [Candidatus Limnocylindrales bacterium]